MSWPSSRIRPAVGSISRLIIRSEVVLPQPLGPTRTIGLAAGHLQVEESTASVPPGYRFVTLSKVIKTWPLPWPGPWFLALGVSYLRRETALPPQKSQVSLFGAIHRRLARPAAVPAAPRTGLPGPGLRLSAQATRAAARRLRRPPATRARLAAPGTGYPDPVGSRIWPQEHGPARRAGAPEPRRFRVGRHCHS